jgi:hypothetical protein
VETRRDSCSGSMVSNPDPGEVNKSGEVERGDEAKEERVGRYRGMQGKRRKGN